MALHRNGPVSTAMVAMALVFMGPDFASGQTAGQFEGNWCHLEQGCSDWSTLFAIEADRQDRDRIRIRYRDTDFVIFDGTISKREHVVWTITGKLEGTGREGNVNRQLTATVTVTGDIAGTITETKLDGVREKTVLLPFKGEMEGLGEAVKTGKEVTVSGHVKGKIDAPGGEEVKGLFDGKLAKEQTEKLIVDGSYVPPPARCSGPRGKARTEEQTRAKNERLRRVSEGHLYAEAREPSPAEIREAQKQGTFVRRVQGAVGADRNTITLELPALPVLDYKCSVGDKVQPASQLKLVRQAAIGKRETH